MKFHQLTSEQRYTISVLLQKEMSKKAIAEAIGVHRSTVYREIERNSSEYTGKYTYTVAVRRARRRKRRYQRPRKMTPEMWRNISKYLRMGWSAQQICGRMKALGRKCVSHMPYTSTSSGTVMPVEASTSTVVSSSNTGTTGLKETKSHSLGIGKA